MITFQRKQHTISFDKYILYIKIYNHLIVFDMHFIIFAFLMLILISIDSSKLCLFRISLEVSWWVMAKIWMTFWTLLLELFSEDVKWISLSF